MSDLTPFPPHPLEITLLIASHLPFDSLRIFASASHSTRKALKPLLLTCWESTYSDLYNMGWRGRVVTYSNENPGTYCDPDPVPRQSVKLVSWLLWFLLVSDYSSDADLKASVNALFGVHVGDTLLPGLYAVQCLSDVMQLRNPRGIEGGALARRYNALLAPRESLYRQREMQLVEALIGDFPLREEVFGSEFQYTDRIETWEEDGMLDLEVFSVVVLEVLLHKGMLDEMYVVWYFLGKVCRKVMERKDDAEHVVEDEAKYEEILELVLEKMPGCVAKVQDQVVRFVPLDDDGVAHRCVNGPANLKEMGNVAAWLFASAYSEYDWDEAEGNDRMMLWFERFRNQGLTGCFDLALAHCFTDFYVFRWKATWIPVLLELGADPNAVLRLPLIVGDPDVTWTPLHPVMSESGSIEMFRLFLEKDYTGIDLAIQVDGQLERQVPMVYLAHQYRLIQERQGAVEDSIQISAEDVLQMLKELLESRPGCIDLPQWSEVLEIAEDLKVKGDDSLYQALSSNRIALHT